MISFPWLQHFSLNPDPNWQVKTTFTDIFLRHGYKAEDKVRLDAFPIECQQAVEMAKQSYLANLGDKLNNPNTS